MKYLRIYNNEQAYKDDIFHLLYESSASLDYPYIVSFVHGSNQPVRYDSLYIDFIDAYVKERLLAAYDENGDGKLSTIEAGVIEDLGTMFVGDENLTTFNDVYALKMLKTLDLHNSAIEDIDISENYNLITINMEGTFGGVTFGDQTQMTPMQRQYYNAEVPESEIESFFGADGDVNQSEINNFFDNL